MRKPVGKRLLPPATVGALPLDSTPAGLSPASPTASLAAPPPPSLSNRRLDKGTLTSVLQPRRRKRIPRLQ